VDLTGTGYGQSNPSLKKIPTPFTARIHHVFTGMPAGIDTLRRIDQYGAQPYQQTLGNRCIMDI
jgi:hypothetical protein